MESLNASEGEIMTPDQVANEVREHVQSWAPLAKTKRVDRVIYVTLPNGQTFTITVAEAS